MMASCSKNASKIVESPTLQSVIVSPSSATVAVGKTQQFTATAHFSDGSAKPLPEVSWTTSVPALAAVSSNGLVTPVGQGQFTVFATFEKLAGSASLTVEPVKATEEELASRCPASSKEVHAMCRAITYEDLPDGARGLLRRLQCDTGPGSNYNYGTAVDLNGDGIPEYQFCCHEASHGPCGAVLLGRIGTEWRDLTDKYGMLGFEGPCKGFIVLPTRHGGFHDICLPDECAPSSKTGTCNPTIWHYDGAHYQLADTPTRDNPSN